MDEDIIEYCKKTITLINDYSNNYEKIIALVLREIKDNEYVYINRHNRWYKYDKDLKEWKETNFRVILLDRVNGLYEFFDSIMIIYLNTQNILPISNRTRLINISRRIAENIYEERIDLNRLEREFKIAFKIDTDI